MARFGRRYPIRPKFIRPIPASAPPPSGVIAARSTLTASYDSGTTTLQTVPTWVTGDLLVWTFSVTSATTPATPAGWTLIQSGTTAALSMVVCYRLAASEPTDYTATVTSGRSSSVMTSFSGVDSTTPIDVASPAANAGVTSIVFNAITPITTNAWVLGCLAINVASGVTGTTISTTGLDAIQGQVSTSSAVATNNISALGTEVWASGAFTPDMASSNASIRSLAITAALRPGTGGAPATETIGPMSPIF